VESARKHFRDALAVWGNRRQAIAAAGLDFPGRRIAQQSLQLLSEDKGTR
jgi:hypothetical protein